MLDPYKLIKQYFTDGREKEFSTLSLFEAGFCDLGPLLDLYCKLPFSNYHGIEQFRINDLKISYDDKNGGRSEFARELSHSPYRKYLDYCNGADVIKVLPENQFDLLFNLEFNTFIEEFIAKNSGANQVYSMGVFSNLFHKFKNKEIPHNIVKWFYNNSTSQAYLLFKVMTSEEFVKNGDDFIYTLSDINELIAHFPGEILINESNGSFDSYLVKKN